MPIAQVNSAPSSLGTRIGRQISIFEMVLLLLLAALAVWKGLIPGWKVLNTDFPNYYVVARLIREHYCLDRIYDWIWFQRIAGKFGISQQLVGFLGLTPFSALPIIPLSWLPVLEAKRVWIVCNGLLLAAALYPLSKQTGLSYRRVWLIALCAVIPLRTGLLFGQMHILVLVLLVAAYVCHMRGRQIASGSCIALAAALKVYPIFFCAYFLIKKRWKALGAALAGIGFCLFLSYLAVGGTAMRAYLFQQLPRLLQGQSGNPFLPSLTSASALFHRLFLYEPELNPHPLISSPGLYALLYPLWQAVLAGIVLSQLRTGFRADERENLEWSMFLCLLMFLSSAPASYQFVVLIAAAVPTISLLLKERRWKATCVYLVLYIAATNIRTIPVDRPANFLMLLLYLKLWSGIALIVFYCVLLRQFVVDRKVKDGILLWSPAFRTGAIVLCLWLPGTYSAWAHLRRMRPSSSVLANVGDEAYMRISPVRTDQGLLYVAMLQPGYRVLGTAMAFSDGDTEPINELSFAATRSGKDVWIEAASDRRSRLVPITSEKQAADNCKIDDAETPALSGDGSVLAFVREDHGHGSLWTVDLQECAASRVVVPVRVTAPSFDVRTVADGPGKTFLISAIDQGRERLFTVSAGAAPQPLAEGNGPLDSPALSPNGKTLVVRELISGRWQLMSLDLSSRAWRQLTYGDCNAYTPSWSDDHTVLYATDCMRGMGFATLASLAVER